MRYLTTTAASYVGVDLHARTLFLCVLDQAGNIRLSHAPPRQATAVHVGCSRREFGEQHLRRDRHSRP